MCDMELVENTHTAVPICSPLDDDDPGHREPAKPLTGDSTPQPHRTVSSTLLVGPKARSQ